jgi:hypothetical protein
VLNTGSDVVKDVFKILVVGEVEEVEEEVEDVEVEVEDVEVVVVEEVEDEVEEELDVDVKTGWYVSR